MEESGLTNHGVGDTQLQQGILMGSPDKNHEVYYTATTVQYIIVQYITIQYMVQYSCYTNHGVGDTHFGGKQRSFYFNYRNRARTKVLFRGDSTIT